MIHAIINPVVGWLGFGGIVIVAAIVVGVMIPRFLYVALIVAAIAGAAVFVFAKGAYYAHSTDKKVEAAGASAELKQEEHAKARAEHRVSHPLIINRWMRDPYARD